MFGKGCCMFSLSVDVFEGSYQNAEEQENYISYYYSIIIHNIKLYLIILKQDYVT